MTSNPAFVTNVDRSRVVGLTVYLTPEGFAAASEVFAGNDGLRKYLEVLSPGSESEPASLRLENGAYYAGFGGHCFYGSTHMYDDEFINSEDRFHMGYAQVVRIVSSNDDVWQNWLFDESGNPKDGYAAD